MSATVNRFRVFEPVELAALVLTGALALVSVFPENTLTELVNKEKDSAITIKYLNSIIRVNPDNKYKFLLADSYMGAGLYSKALITINMIHPENAEVLFRKDLYTLSLLEKTDRRTEEISRRITGLKDGIGRVLSTTSDPELLALAYSRSLQAKAYFAAALAAGRLSSVPGKNRLYWLSNAAAAYEKDGDIKTAAPLYLQLALIDPDIWNRRMFLKRSFDEMATSGDYAGIKRAIEQHVRVLAGDKHTAATMLSYSRKTGDAALSRHVALAILSGGAI